MLHAPFQVGEIVAIAQKYADIYFPTSGVNRIYNESLDLYEDALAYSQGWNNKIFVRADLMPHHIRITSIKIEHLQEITNKDCLKEGVKKANIGYYVDGLRTKDWEKESHIETENGECYKLFPNSKEAFAALIDKVGKKGDWDKNPWVYVYEFEVID